MPQINSKRLKSLLDGVNCHGRNPETGGYNRVAYSDADMAVRRWFAERMRADGLSVSMDGVANVFGRYGPADGPAILAGSHLDTVPEGGAFDGALGACVALECVRAMQDAEFRPAIAIEVVATADEEGRFGGMLGSQALAGGLSRRDIEQARDADGIGLAEAMALQGLDAFDALRCARPPGSVLGFLELHVEQGPVLEGRGIPIGIADSVAGVSNLMIHFEGTANHSGTTPMDMRADAFAGLADFAVGLPDLIERGGSDAARITIGKVDLAPNFPHTIPGVAAFTVNIRDVDEAVQRSLTHAVTRRAQDVAGNRGLAVSIEELSWLSPVGLDADLVGLLRQEADALALESLVMASGAGHDAQTMQALCPSALVFVPSKAGLSHAPNEQTDWPDIEKGAQLMLNALIRLSSSARG